MLEAALALVAGLLIGSFLNVCIHRLPRDLSIVRPRSHCTECNTPLAWYDNIPILSYILLHGRCRQCNHRIPVRYLVVEALTGLLFLLIVLALGVNLPSLKLCLLSALLVGLIFCDAEQRILPDELTLGGVVAGLVFATVVPMEWEYAHLLLPARWDDKLLSAGESVFGAAFASGLLWVVGVVYEKVRHKEGLGFGDVKMMAMVGTFLGMVDAFRTLILGSLLGSVLGIVYIRLTKKDFATYELPFGSVLGATALILALYRTRVLSFYLPFLP